LKISNWIESIDSFLWELYPPRKLDYWSIHTTTVYHSTWKGRVVALFIIVMLWLPVYLQSWMGDGIAAMIF